ncbi:MAG: class F sortase [Candidatus Saccharimonadales bacterium]
MEAIRLKLDNPIFEGKVRYTPRETQFVRRTMVGAETGGLAPQKPQSSVQPTLAPASTPHSKIFTVQSVQTSAPQKSQAVRPAKQTFLPQYKHKNDFAGEPPHLPTADASQSAALFGPSGVVPQRTVVSKKRFNLRSVYWRIRLYVVRLGKKALKLRYVTRSKVHIAPHHAVYAAAAAMFLLGLAISLNGFRANQKVAVQIKQAQVTTQKAAGSDPNVKGATTPTPSAEVIPPQVVKQYVVAPTLPKYLDIPKLGVHARVLSQGLDKEGALQVPWNIYDTGWYNSSGQPGQTGAMLIAGHSGIGRTHGVFHALGNLTQGDVISIVRGDNTTYNYKVVSVQTVGVDDVNMESMMHSATPGKQGLNLITCTGDQIPGTDRLNQRVLVRAAAQ